MDAGGAEGVEYLPITLWVIQYFPPESLVCYTFVEQISAGIVARPGKCGYSCGVLAGKVAPCGAA